MTRSSWLATLLLVGAARGAAAEPPRDQPPGDASLPSGLAVGVELGNPSSLTARWALLDGRLGVSVAVGTGTVGGTGLSIRGGADFAPVMLYRGRSAVVPLRLGLGGRYYRHDYEPMSIDELPDLHGGVYASLAIGVVLASPAIEAYVEVAPGYDLWRTEGCSLASGTASLCPHVQSSRAFAQLVLGARWSIGK